MKEIDLTNTPGIYYAIAYFISSCLYINLNSRKIHGLKLFLYQAIFGIFLSIFMTVTADITVIFFIPCVLVDFGLILLSFMLSCDMNWKKASYFSIRAFILGEFAASFAWQLFYFSVTNWQLKINLFCEVLYISVTYGVVFTLMFLLEKKYQIENSHLSISGRDLRVSILLGLIVYMMSNISYVFNNTPFSSQFPSEIFIIRTLADLSGVGILFAYHMQLQEINVKLENEFLQKTLQMQYENYKISEESIALVNQKYHDLKHQIEFLRNTDDVSEKNAYLEQMENEIKVYESQYKTGNKILDTILVTKSLQCQNQGISLTCVADGKVLDFMSPMDISALFGNALDNAIESSKKLANPEKRLIHLSVSKQKNFVRIKVENCFEGEIKFKDGLPATTKSDKRYHGFGIKSIKQIVEKYGGSVTMETKDGWFELRILFAGVTN